MRDGGDHFTLRNQDFNVRSFRSTTVLRWEWRPGSTVYLVWQQDRSQREALGARVVEEMPYSDHHAFRDEEIMLILEVAAKHRAAAVTTEKDFARLSPDARRMVETLPVRIEFEAPAEVEAMLAKVFTR